MYWFVILNFKRNLNMKVFLYLNKFNILDSNENVLMIDNRKFSFGC